MPGRKKRLRAQYFVAEPELQAWDPKTLEQYVNAAATGQ